MRVSWPGCEKERTLVTKGVGFCLIQESWKQLHYHDSCLLIPSALGSRSQPHQHSAILNLLRLPKIPGMLWAYSHQHSLCRENVVQACLLHARSTVLAHHAASLPPQDNVTVSTSGRDWANYCWMWINDYDSSLKLNFFHWAFSFSECTLLKRVVDFKHGGEGIDYITAV